MCSILFLNSCKKDNPSPEESTYSQLQTWEITKRSHNLDILARDIFFINPNIGFIVGYNGSIYKTNNAGNSWQKQNSNTTLPLFSVFFINEQIGFSSGKAISNCLDDDCEKGAIFIKTLDGGKSWSKIFLEDYSEIKSLHFKNENTGLALIYAPAIFDSYHYHLAKTIDGGSNWTFIDLPVDPTNQKIDIIDNSVFIKGKNNKIFNSPDYGETWDTIDTPYPVSTGFRNFYFFNEQIGFIEGGEKTYKTINGGESWDIANLPFSSLNYLHFYNENEGINIEPEHEYIGGDWPTFMGSKCYSTNNGGSTWYESELVNSLSIGIVHFPRSDLGYGLDNSHFFTIEKN